MDESESELDESEDDPSSDEEDEADEEESLDEEESFRRRRDDALLLLLRLLSESRDFGSPPPPLRFEGCEDELRAGGEASRGGRERSMGLASRLLLPVAADRLLAPASSSSL